MENKYKEERKNLIDKLFTELKKDIDNNTIKENLTNVMENIILVAKSENYEATVFIKLEEK